MIKCNYLLIFIVSLLAFSSCENKGTTFYDWVGTWVSSDNAKIILKEDSSCVVDNLKGAYFGYEGDLYLEGTWSVKKGVFPIVSEISISSNNGEGMYITFYASGEGLLGNKPPWHLFQYIGDPDELNKYRFTKQNE